jgi:hypothetical protein
LNLASWGPKSICLSGEDIQSIILFFFFFGNYAVDAFPAGKSLVYLQACHGAKDKMGSKRRRQ